MDEYDKAFELWYDELDKFDITDSMTFKQALSKAYFSGAAMGTEKCKELADTIVALGVGRLNKYHPEHYDIGESVILAKFFVRDWRVAGALMEKCPAMEIDTIGNPWWVVALRHEKPEKWFKVKGESLPRAIIEACVKARA